MGGTKWYRTQSRRALRGGQPVQLCLVNGNKSNGKGRHPIWIARHLCPSMDHFVEDLQSGTKSWEMRTVINAIEASTDQNAVLTRRLLFQIQAGMAWLSKAQDIWTARVGWGER